MVVLYRYARDVNLSVSLLREQTLNWAIVAGNLMNQTLNFRK